MNLLPEDTQVSAADTQFLSFTILRMARSGVEYAMKGERNYCHLVDSNLTGIWYCFPNHPIGHLTYRAQLLIKAAEHYRAGMPFVINETGPELAGLTTGEAA